MFLEQHCRRSKESFGREYKEVHLWLDEYAGNTNYNTKHRKVRHHWEGIELVRKKWGDLAAGAAKQHILDDLRTGEGSKADESWIPADEEDYVNRGYW